MRHTVFYHASMGCQWAGQRSRYSDWLRAGRSGDRIPMGGEIFRTCPDRPWGQPSLLYHGYRVFTGVKQPGRVVNHPPHLPPRLKKEQSYLYSLYGPYGLYRASVHVQGCTLPAVRPVQSLSACTRVHFTGRTACTEPQCLYKGALYRPYCMYRASVPVQGCTL